MKKIIMFLILFSIVVYGSGCFALIGGIIGHQSGEAAAGAAIGAAIDVTQWILSADQNKKQEEKREKQKQAAKTKVHADMGYIRADYCLARNKDLTNKLLDKFKELDWKYEQVKSQKEDGDKIVNEIYKCQTSEQKNFNLEIFQEKDSDIRIYVKPEPESQELKSMITSRLGLWVQEIMGD